MKKHTAIIKVQDLKKYYRRGQETVKAIDGVDFEISQGEIVSIVGPSGCGKTTLMNLISCLDQPTSGTLWIADVNVTDLKEENLIKIRRENIGFIFQQFYLVPTLTARENVELPLIFAKKIINQQKVLALLSEIGLQAKAQIQAKYLSGADKQRIGIARAMVNDPKLIIADEPTGKLDTKARDELLVIFKKLSETGPAIFIATHDLELAAVAGRIIHLQDGRIIPQEESVLYQ